MRYPTSKRIGPTGVSYRAPTPQERCKCVGRMSAIRGDTSLMSQNVAPERGPLILMRNSFESSQSVNPPMGIRHAPGLYLGEVGSHDSWTCCAAVAGFRNGTSP